MGTSARPLPKQLGAQRCFGNAVAAVLDAIRSRRSPRAYDAAQLLIDEVQADAFVGRDTGWHPISDEALICRPPLPLAVVVGRVALHREASAAERNDVSGCRVWHHVFPDRRFRS